MVKNKQQGYYFNGYQMQQAMLDGKAIPILKNFRAK